MPQKSRAATAKRPSSKGMKAKSVAKKAVKKAASSSKAKAAPKAKVASKAKEANKAREIAKAKEALKKVARPSAPLAEVKESAPKVRPRKLSVDIQPNEAASALAQKWSALYKKANQIESKPYNMKGTFEEKTAIVHKVLGWGYILANRNDRLEVLFKDGIKYLISNYNP